MSLNVNQAFLQYYQARLGSLSTKHQVQSNRVTLFSERIMDTAKQINFYEQQKVLTLATPSGEQLAIKAEYFDLPLGFDSDDSSTWEIGGENKMFYTTPCQKQLFIYRKASDEELADSNNASQIVYNNSGVGYIMIPYEHTGTHDTSSTSPYTEEALSYGIQDSNYLSSALASGEYTLVYTNDSFEKEVIRYQDLSFISEKEDDTAYQQMIEMLDAERYNLQEMEKGVKSEMQTTETEIQAINSLMESTEKTIKKNTEIFKWG